MDAFLGGETYVKRIVAVNNQCFVALDIVGSLPGNCSSRPVANFDCF